MRPHNNGIAPLDLDTSDVQVVFFEVRLAVVVALWQQLVSLSGRGLASGTESL